MSISATLTFGPLLKQLRKQAGMTQRDLATALGYSTSLISSLEKAKRRPDLKAVVEQFIPALGLQDDPHAAAYLTEQAALARGERPPASATLQRAIQLSVHEEQTVKGTRLPAPPTTLIGRTAQVNQLCNRLRGHGGRLLTLLGPPGIGKTTLALAVASQLQPYYADGVVFVALAAISEPALMASSILAAVGGSDLSPPQTKLIEFLRRKTMLLVLDNLEQIRDAAPLIATLLAECPALTILATSRERLHLRAEQRYKVPLLDLAPAVELFVQRAQAVDTTFSLTPDNQSTLEAICQRLDCLPLALELCAAQIELLAPTQLLVQLQERRLDLLVDGARDLPSQQRTLRAAIGRSYAMLTDVERRLLRSLSIFVGGFDLPAIETVSAWAQETSAPSLLSTLHALIGKSLVRAETTPTGEQRFLLLETIREFVMAQLSSEERMTTQQRHATYFVAQAVTELSVLARDHANFRAALVWAIDVRDVPAALALCVKLCRFWETHGYLHEGMALARTALAMANTTSNETCSGRGNELAPDLQIDALERVATLAWLGHTFDVALPLAEEAAILARRNDRPGKLALALHLLGRIAMEQGNYEAAEAALQESTQLAHQVAYLFNPGCPLTQLSEVALARGDWATAQAHLVQAIPYLEDTPEGLHVSVHLAVAHTNLAEIALAHGNPQQAHHALQQAFPHARYYIRRLRCLLITFVGILLHTPPAIQTQDVAAAAEVLGAVAGLGERSGDPLSPLYQARIAERAQSVQQLMTQDEWQSAWTQGHAWTLTQAADEAERWLALDFTRASATPD